MIYVAIYLTVGILWSLLGYQSVVQLHKSMYGEKLKISSQIHIAHTLMVATLLWPSFVLATVLGSITDLWEGK